MLKKQDQLIGANKTKIVLLLNYTGSKRNYLRLHNFYFQGRTLSGFIKIILNFE